MQGSLRPPADTLYREILRRGIPHDSHESDLYLPSTPDTLALVRQYGRRYSSFTYEANGPAKGTLWLDVAFAFDPWWEGRTARAKWVAVKEEERGR